MGIFSAIVLLNIKEIRFFYLPIGIAKTCFY